MSAYSLIVTVALAMIPTAVLAVEDPTYFSYNIDEPNLDGLRLLDNFAVDERNHSITSEDFGLIYEACPPGWKCLPMEGFQFAVPTKCSKRENATSWVFKERTFSVPEALASQGFNGGRKIYVIDITNADGSRYGTATYSLERGLESFARVDTQGPFLKLQTYLLASDKGSALGGCMPKGISTDRRHWRPNTAPGK